MDHVDGQPLDEAWPSLSPADKQTTLAQLRDYMRQVRQVRQVRGPFIGAVDGSICNDQLFANREHVYGPYPDEDAFRAGIAQSLRACDANAFTQMSINMIRAMPTSDNNNRFVLTHGDLVPRNILVREGGHVAAIVDWEMAGFYPEYWEYARPISLPTTTTPGRRSGPSTRSWSRIWPNWPPCFTQGVYSRFRFKSYWSLMALDPITEDQRNGNTRDILVGTRYHSNGGPTTNTKYARAVEQGQRFHSQNVTGRQKLCNITYNGTRADLDRKLATAAN